jgi:beta-lactamase class A
LGVQAAAAQPSRSVDRELERLGALTQGVVGVAALHLETGRWLELNGRDRFPMASTYKVPIAVLLLTEVDRGQLALDSLVRLTAGDLYPATYGIVSEYLRAGSALTIANLLELMIIVSDNDATDALLRVLGGTSRVTARMRELGLEAIRVDRPTWAVLANHRGRAEVSEAHPISPAEFGALMATTDSPAEDAAHEADFDRDPRDTTTPEAMASLLGALWRGQILGRASTGLLLDFMYRCQTAPGRMKGALPAGTRVAHKSGTIGAATSDVGIIDLPGNAGHVATAIYLKRSKLSDPAARDSALAQIGRAVYDYFLFSDPVRRP